MKKKILHRFRMIALAEGVSFLLLLLIAMPLKYFFKIPQAVKLVGWTHGALFVAYIYLAFEVFAILKKSFGWLLLSFAASVIPGGTFLQDISLKKDEAAL